MNIALQRNWISKVHPAGARGVLVLMAVLVLAVITTQAAQAQTFTTLHSFEGTDGYEPLAGLIQATNGSFYGTTQGAGATDGTVFKVTLSGTLTTLHSFDGADGDSPQFSALVQASDGNLYGTTNLGGAYTCLISGVNYGCGTVFKITPGGTLTTLHSFDGTDGEYPDAGLVQAIDGNLYGTTSGGGANGDGTVFKITLSGTLTTLHTFDSTDGANAEGALVQATNGNLYGTTSGGGTNGDGTVFKITPSGTLTTLYSFTDGADGGVPFAGLIQAADGNFYGTAGGFGASGYGTVFKITPTGTLTTLHSFDDAEGFYVLTALVQANDGNFYGTNYWGGANSVGTVFKITPGGTLTTLYNFCPQSGCTDGSSGVGLVQDTNGTFYGTTASGGTDNDGTVFSLSVGLGPFVETRPTSGKVGAAVKILGSNLTGATSVTFNGTAATFTVVSKSEITTTVPTGATTGTVEVTVSGHTLKSNTKFRVTP